MTGPHGRRDDSGAVAVIAAITTAALLFVIGGMAVDLGDAFARRETLQTAADLAALAGAKELPDVGQARTAAIASLCSRGADENTVQGWPAQACTQTTWASDGDVSNGEIQFTGEDEEPITTGRATSIRVVTPRATVQFHLASAVGFSSVDVQRASTTAMGTPAGPLGVAPFYLVDRNDEDPKVCFWVGGSQYPPPTDGTTCDASRANRGFVAAPRTTVTAVSALQENIARGIDHSVVPWTAYPVQPANPAPSPQTACSLSPGTSTTFGFALAPSTPVNCLPLATGSVAADATAGFFDATSGRLRQTSACSGDSNSDSVGVWSQVDANSLFQNAFLNPSTTATISQIRDYVSHSKDHDPFPTNLRGALSSAVLSCPRLSLVPVVSLPDSGTNGYRVPPTGAQYPVIGMRYVWFGDDDTAYRFVAPSYYSHRGFVFSLYTGALVGIKAWQVDPRLLPASVAGSPVVNAWTGTVWPGRQGYRPGEPQVPGPRQIRLTHDSADPIPPVP